MPATLSASALGVCRRSMPAGRQWSATLVLPVLPAVGAPVSPPAPGVEGGVEAEMPAGWRVDEHRDGLHLIRESDGRDMGIMSSARVAAGFAGALSRNPVFQTP